MNVRIKCPDCGSDRIENTNESFVYQNSGEGSRITIHLDDIEVCKDCGRIFFKDISKDVVDRISDMLKGRALDNK